MIDRVPLGRSDLEVPRLGVGAMTWGSPSGRSRWGPAKLAYGGTAGPEEEQLAFEASLSAGGELFGTAAVCGGGPSGGAWRRGWTCSTRLRCTAGVLRSGAWASLPRAGGW